MSGWAEYYDRANEVGDDVAWAEMRSQEKQRLDWELEDRQRSLQLLRERQTHEALAPLLERARVLPETEHSYLRTVYLEWVTGIREFTPAELLAEMRAAQARD